MYIPRDYQAKGTKVTIRWLQQNPGKHGIVAVATGGGKSIMIADLIKEVQERWPTKVLVLSHSKEILQQDEEKLRKLLPDTNIQLFSASLGSKKIGQVTIGSVQTVINSVEKFKDVRLIIVDECQSIQAKGEGAYNKIFVAIPQARVVGYTATPFRYNGWLTDSDHMFHEIIYNVRIRTLIAKGYLSKIFAKATKQRINTSKLKVVAGDYSKKSLQEEIDRFGLTRAICDDMSQFKSKRDHWLIFCVSIKHAEHVAMYLTEIGIPTMAVHSKMPMRERELILRLYQEGKLQAVTNVGVLTVGFDFPGIDLLSFLRPTKSHVLHRQMTGRGMRPSPGKTDCIVLDYAGNFGRLGPIDEDPVFATKGGGGGGVAPTKECPECDEIVPLSVRICPDCGYEFPETEKLFIHAQGAQVLANLAEHVKPKKYEVHDVFYGLYAKPGKPPTLKVTYKLAGLKRIPEWIGLESEIKGFRTNARRWWLKRAPNNSGGLAWVPESVELAMPLVRTLLKPQFIEVDETDKFPKIVAYHFKEF